MIDLHVHTTVSDGTVSPQALVRLAKKSSLSAVALTDHDSVAGLKEAALEAEKLGITLVNGIEFSCRLTKDRLVHILGLGIDPEAEGFVETLTRFREIRASKLTHVFRGIHELGAEVSYLDVEPFVEDGFMDRMTIAKYLVRNGYATGMKEAWIRYLDHVPYIDGELMDPSSAIEAIHAAGGKAFLAHFHMPIGLKGLSDEEAREQLQRLKDWGLDGLEYYYPSFTKEDQLICAQYVADFGFIKSGGSDFHGENRAHIQLGVGDGTLKVPDELLKHILVTKAEEASA